LFLILFLLELYFFISSFIILLIRILLIFQVTSLKDLIGLAWIFFFHVLFYNWFFLYRSSIGLSRSHVLGYEFHVLAQFCSEQYFFLKKLIYCCYCCLIFYFFLSYYQINQGLTQLLNFSYSLKTQHSFKPFFCWK
jgi:hypothetical protein